MDRREDELRRRREEQRRIARRSNGVKVKKKRKRRGGLLLFMASLLLIGVVLVSVFTFLFPVKTITVEGNGRYTANEVIEATGITSGDNLLVLSEENIEQKVRKQCPYIYEVSLQRKLPSRVIVTVVEKGPTLSFVAGKQYVLATDRYELIEAKAAKSQGICVYGVAVTAGEVGAPLTFVTEESKTLLDTLLSELTAQSITQITQIDMRDVSHIRLLYDDRHVWELGDLKNLSYKLQFGALISQNETVTGTVNLSDLVTGDKGYFSRGMIGDFISSDVTKTDVN